MFIHTSIFASLFKQLTYYSITSCTKYFLPVLRLFYSQNIILKKNFVDFDVENEILDRGCYGYKYFGSTCRDEQNEPLNETFEQTWNLLYKKKLEKYF